MLGAPKAAESCECTEALNGTAKLKIKKPTDDGGVPITGYTIEKLDPDTGNGSVLHTYQLIRPEVAMSLML